MNQSERWLPVAGFDGYEVSDRGRVRSLDRVLQYRRLDQYGNGMLTINRTHRGRILRPGPSQSGHLSVVLGQGNTMAVHVMVLTAFTGPSPERMECRHLDGVPSHNWHDNLVWGTRSENLHDAVRHGVKAIGERVHCSKLTADKVLLIRRLLPTTRVIRIAEKFSVSESSIRQVRDGISWKHIQLESAA